jgi:hypothetical protein
MVSNNKNSEFKTVNKLTIKQVFVAKKNKAVPSDQPFLFLGGRWDCNLRFASIANPGRRYQTE